MSADLPTPIRAPRRTRVLQRLLPLLAVAAFVGGWEAAVRIGGLPAWLLPAPSQVLSALWQHRASLAQSWWVTLQLTASALALACIGGAGLAALFALWRPLEWALTPFTVVLQVTPVIAVAPLIMIVTDSAGLTVLACAFIVAFFPVLSNTLAGLRSADPGLRELFRLHGASRWQTLCLLLLPGALPYFLAGLRIAGGLSLIGAVVAEFVAGTGGTGTGLAYQILQAGYQLNIPRMFAALLLITVTGVLLLSLIHI